MNFIPRAVHVISNILPGKYVSFYIDNYSSPWKHFLSHLLKNQQLQGGKFILHCNFSVTDLPKDLPKFYIDSFYLANNNILTEKQALSDILEACMQLRFSTSEYNFQSK